MIFGNLISVFPEATDCPVSPLIHPAGIRVGDPCPIEERIQHPVNGVVEKPVADQRLVDVTRFRVRNFEGLVLAVAVHAGRELVPELEDVVHQTRLEYLDVGLVPFAGQKLAPGSEQIIDGNDIIKRMSEIPSAPKILPVIEHMLSVYRLWFGYRDNLPKKSRYTLGEKIDGRFIDALELLFVASYQSAQDKFPTLVRALTAIDTLKFLVRIAWDLRLLDNKKYTALSEGLHEIGRQTGAWKKGIEKKTPA